MSTTTIPTSAPAAVASLAPDDGKLAAHITAVVAAVVGIIDLFHPGFHQPAVVEAAIPAVAGAVAFAIEAVHLVSHRGLKGTLAQAWADAESMAHVVEHHPSVAGSAGSAAAPAPAPAKAAAKAK